jgi:hypothetical protein
MWAQSLNLTRSFRAGFSDFFAAAIVGDPEYVHTTGTTVDTTRQLDPPAPRCYAAETIDLTSPRETYDPHPLGAIISSVLWDTEANRADEQQQFNQSVVAAAKAYGAALQMQGASLTLAQAVNAVAGALYPDLQPRLCGTFADRLGLAQTDLPSCMSFATPEMSCAAQ